MFVKKVEFYHIKVSKVYDITTETVVTSKEPYGLSNKHRSHHIMIFMR